MHRLQDFLTRVVLPRLSELDSASSRSPEQLAMTYREIMEALLWLHLGVEVGIFPVAEARTAYEIYKRLFFTTIIPSGQFLQFSQPARSYAAHSELSQQLYVELPRYAGVLLEKGMRGEDPFTTEQLELRNSAALSGLCQTLLLLYSEFATSSNVRQFTYLVSFAPKDEWNAAWRSSVDPETLISSDPGDLISPMESAFSGYLELWGFGTRCRDVFIAAEGRDETDSADRFKLQDRLQDVLQWRINLRHTSGMERFEKIREKVDREIERESTQPGVDPEAAKLIQRSMQDAFNQIGIPQLAIA